MLIDLTSPGITVRPIELISGASAFCEIFFDDVRVPATAILGEINRGWDIAKALLVYERELWGGAGGGGRRSAGSALGDFARSHRGETVDGAVVDPVVRDRIAQFEIDSLALSLTVHRGRDAAKVGLRPGAEMSVLKYSGAELSKRRHELMMDIAGPEALRWEDETGSELAALAPAWLRSRANSIEGGTSETQLNIIAKRVLNLPIVK